MDERQLLKSVVVLNKIRQHLSETLADFYGRYHKEVNKIDQQVIDKGEICYVFYVGLDPLNKASIEAGKPTTSSSSTT